jgi:hypothetical protein
MCDSVGWVSLDESQICGGGGGGYENANKPLRFVKLIFWRLFQ